MVLLPLFVACGNTASPAGATGATQSTTTSTTGSMMTTGSGMCPGNLDAVDNSEWCKDVAAKTDCSLVTDAQTLQVCGVPLSAPTADLKRSSNVTEFKGSGPPQLDCYATGKYPAKNDPTKSTNVKMKGVAKIFSSGCMSNDLTIEVYTVKRGGAAADEGDVDKLVGTAVTTVTDCTATGTMEANDKCGTRYECPYNYDGVPTETELLIKTYGATWAPLYDYNIYIPQSEAGTGEWAHDVRALATDDYSTIPTVAYGHTIDQGNGVIAGEVHDCGDVRLSNAIVNIDIGRAAFTYFTPNEQNPLPDSSAQATSQLGLYAAFNLTPGPVHVAAIGNVGGKTVTAGFFTARIFPDAVTAVTFRGLRPFQVP